MRNQEVATVKHEKVATTVGKRKVTKTHKKPKAQEKRIFVG